MARDLTIWLVAGCLTLSAPVAFWGYRTAVNKAEADLRQKAAALCSSLGVVLHQQVWNLDTAGIEAHFRARDCQFPDGLSFICITTQYGDPIFDYSVSSRNGVVAHRKTLFNGDEEIGVIEVGLSRAGIEEYRRQAATLALALAVLVTVTIGILSAILVRLLLGRSLDILIRQLRAVADGNYSGRLPPHRYREVDAINAEVNLMVGRIATSTAALHAEIDERGRVERALKSMSEHLETLVDRRTSQLKEINEELVRESSRRKSIEREIIEISNREQHRIGQDLHDSLCQELAGIAYLAGSLERNLRTKGSPDAGMAKQVASLLLESVSHIRRVAKGLNPVELETNGLVMALKGIAADMEEIFHIHCTFTCTGDGIIHNNDIAVHLFHITREAIHNAIRHGHASMIDIRLVTEHESGSIVISDNGSGFVPQRQSKEGMGLNTMMYRMEIIGGKLDIQSGIHAGTTVTASFANSAAWDREPAASGLDGEQGEGAEE
jgi:signal transduction histidine kinase